MLRNTKESVNLTKVARRILARDANAALLMTSTKSDRGYSVIETLIVVALVSVLSAIAIPQVIAERRLSRSVAMTREILSQIRRTRQMAMSQRQAFTFQLNNATRQISIIDHNDNSGTFLLANPAFPNNAGSTVVTSVPLATGGLIASEITYGIPTGLPVGPLRDGSVLTVPANNVVNLTFQPDGSVIDVTGSPSDRALFFYNSSAARATASAISILGASGRVKIWRYSANANVYSD